MSEANDLIERMERETGSRIDYNMTQPTKTRAEIEAELGRQMNPAEVYTWLAASLMNKNDRARDLLLDIYIKLPELHEYWIVRPDVESLDVRMENMILELGGELPPMD